MSILEHGDGCQCSQPDDEEQFVISYEVALKSYKEIKAEGKEGCDAFVLCAIKKFPDGDMSVNVTGVEAAQDGTEAKEYDPNMLFKCLIALAEAVTQHPKSPKWQSAVAGGMLMTYSMVRSLPPEIRNNPNGGAGLMGALKAVFERLGTDEAPSDVLKNGDQSQSDRLV